MKTGATVLYLTYDGLTDPLGQSQVLPYLEGLSALGHRIAIISCEKPEAFAAGRADIAERCARSGIDWQPLRYRKWPPVLSTVIDLIFMARRAGRIVGQGNIDIVHCRSYLTALIGLNQKRKGHSSFLFDMRGFWIDERFERGIWPIGNPVFDRIAEFLRRMEKRFFRESDAIVSLTYAALPRIEEIVGADVKERVTVIPCCVDLVHFDPLNGERRAEGRAMLGLPSDVPLMLYVGSVGGAYPLEPVLSLFSRWTRDHGEARMLFVTRHDPSEIFDNPIAAEMRDRLIVRAASRDEVPPLLAAADIGVSFILATPCAVASSPTKLGEMLAMGLPVATNSGIGDTATILDGSGAGLVLPDLSLQSTDSAVSMLQGLLKAPGSARKLAKEWFSLEQGISSFDLIYRQLSSPDC